MIRYRVIGINKEDSNQIHYWVIMWIKSEDNRIREFGVVVDDNNESIKFNSKEEGERYVNDKQLR